MNVVVLRGFGLHCYEEVYLNLKKAHKDTYLYDLRSPKTELLDETKFIVIPGGFTFGDELGAGFMLAKFLEEKHQDLYRKITDDKVLVLGICNGFQALVHTQVFPEAKLEHNAQKHFTYKWTKVDVKVKSFWFDGMSSFTACARHGEGRLTTHQPLALTYQENINGNPGAGILSANHLKLGMMPHPEIPLEKEVPILRNGVTYAKERLT